MSPVVDCPRLTGSRLRGALDVSKRVVVAALEMEVRVLRKAGHRALADALTGFIADIAAAYDNAAEPEQQAPGEAP